MKTLPKYLDESIFDINDKTKLISNEPIKGHGILNWENGQMQVSKNEDFVGWIYIDHNSLDDYIEYSIRFNFDKHYHFIDTPQFRTNKGDLDLCGLKFSYYYYPNSTIHLCSKSKPGTIKNGYFDAKSISIQDDLTSQGKLKLENLDIKATEGRIYFNSKFPQHKKCIFRSKKIPSLQVSNRYVKTLDKFCKNPALDFDADKSIKTQGISVIMPSFITELNLEQFPQDLLEQGFWIADSWRAKYLMTHKSSPNFNNYNEYGFYMGDWKLVVKDSSLDMLNAP